MTLLFTSYLVVTAVAMLVTGWVSSRIGAKNTLIAGLILIVVFAGLAGASDTIGGIVGFRAGWGLGNALFIATSLAVIVGSATGGFAGAIVLYETALGVGIACGPLLGAALGNISWRGPFFGVSVLMAIALVATVLFVPRTPRPAAPAPLSAPLKALRHRGLLTMGLTALLYNWGFFTMLGYVPFPMHLSIYGSAPSSSAGACSSRCSRCSSRRACSAASAPPRRSTSTWRCSPRARRDRGLHRPPACWSCA